MRIKKVLLEVIAFSVLLAAGGGYTATSLAVESIDPSAGATVKSFMVLQAADVGWDSDELDVALEGIKGIGATGVRFTVYWKDLQSTRGSDPQDHGDGTKAAFYTRMISKMEKAGLEPMMAFGGLPDWYHGESEAQRDAVISGYVEAAITLDAANDVNAYLVWDEKSDEKDFGRATADRLALISNTIRNVGLSADSTIYLGVDADDIMWKRTLDDWLGNKNKILFDVIGIRHFPGTYSIDHRDWSQLEYLSKEINDEKSLLFGKSAAVLATGYSTYNLLHNQLSQKLWTHHSIDTMKNIIYRNNVINDNRIVSWAWHSFTNGKSQSVLQSNSFGITINDNLYRRKLAYETLKSQIGELNTYPTKPVFASLGQTVDEVNACLAEMGGTKADQCEASIDAMIERAYDAYSSRTGTGRSEIARAVEIAISQVIQSEKVNALGFKQGTPADLIKGEDDIIIKKPADKTERNSQSNFIRIIGDCFNYQCGQDSMFYTLVIDNGNRGLFSDYMYAVYDEGVKVKPGSRLVDEAPEEYWSFVNESGSGPMATVGEYILMNKLNLGADYEVNTPVVMVLDNGNNSGNKTAWIKPGTELNPKDLANLLATIKDTRHSEDKRIGSIKICDNGEVVIASKGAQPETLCHP